MKIGMFPLSGIRVCDTELLEMGLTLPGFVERSKTIASLPSLGLLTLAGMTPARHEISYVEVPDLNDVESLLLDIDLAAISSYSAQMDEAYYLAGRFKEWGIPTVIGGPHVTAVPEEASKHCDSVAIGEGEPLWHRILADAEIGALKKFYRAEADFEMKDAPMPAFELLDMSKYNRLTVQTSRGCPHKCEFCASSVILTGRYKQKPAEKVAAEIEKIMRIWEHPFIEFADDNSFVDRAYWKKLLGLLKGKKFRWFAETDISVAEDAELLEMMRESGCEQVLIGLESPEENSLRGVETKSDWKLRKLPRYKEAVNRIQSAGISVNGCFVIGLDGQGPDIFDRVFDFAEDAGLYEVQITIMTAFPGTPLYSRLEKEGRLMEPANWKKCTLFDINFKSLKMSAKELNKGFKSLGARLYGDECTHKRRNRFRQTLKDIRRKKGGEV